MQRILMVLFVAQFHALFVFLSYNLLMINGAFSLFGNRINSRQGIFDINLLPLNLSEGRNIGDLSGLFLATAPKKAESSRQNDIFIALFYIDNMTLRESEMKTWFDILTETYFSSRGSFTMGVTAAVKKLTSFLSKQYSGKVLPTIFLNIAMLRERTLMLAHAGPVHTTVISSDSVKNFSNEVSLPLQLEKNELSFFNTDVHSEDIILLCPRVPNDWTNSSILEVTGDSPLNAIRFLLDRSGGSLQAAVIQLKTGKGEITFRKKTSITTNIQPEFKDKLDEESSKQKRPADRSGIQNSDDMYAPPASAKPLFRTRKPAALFETEIGSGKNETITEKSDSENEVVTEVKKTETDSLTGARQLPGADELPYDFSEKDTPARKRRIHYSELNDRADRKAGKKQSKAKSGKKSRLNLTRFLLILGCGILVPLIVVSALFFVYSGRSKNEMHSQYLSLAVETAQNALQETDVREKESRWNDVLNYVDQAMSYGTSSAARDLRKQAVLMIDQLNGGISTVYNYANSTKLPQGINITEIASSGQYTYGLDTTSGSVIRFVASGAGLTMDSGFTCTPGSYSEFGKDNSSVQVGRLIDFVLLPAGNPHSFVLAGIDENANVLYCSGFKANQAEKLIKPPTEKFIISGITYANNAMYVLDTQASRVWEYIFSNSDGFAYEPSDFYGSYSPYLSDITDFAMYKEYAYYLKANGTLLMCDYTGYRPDCKTITDVQNADGSVQVVLSRHQFNRILVNSSPDNSLYISDGRLQSILNLSVKGNFVRYIVPNRSSEDISQYSRATGFGITGQNRLLWSYRNDLYIGNMP